MTIEKAQDTAEPTGAASVLSAGLGGWVPMSEKVPEPDTVCVVWCRYSRDTKGFATVDTWALQHEDPLGMGGPTIPTGYGWDDNYESDVLYWMALPAKPDESIDQRWEETPNRTSLTGAGGFIARVRVERVVRPTPLGKGSDAETVEPGVTAALTMETERHS